MKRLLAKSEINFPICSYWKRVISLKYGFQNHLTLWKMFDCFLVVARQDTWQEQIESFCFGKQQKIQSHKMQTAIATVRTKTKYGWERAVYYLPETIFFCSCCLPVCSALWFLSLAVVGHLVLFLMFLLFPETHWLLPLVVQYLLVPVLFWIQHQFGLPCHFFLFSYLK